MSYGPNDVVSTRQSHLTALLLGPAVELRREGESLVVAGEVVEIRLAPAESVEGWIREIRQGIVVDESVVPTFFAPALGALIREKLVGCVPVGWGRAAGRADTDPQPDPDGGEKFARAYLDVCDEWAKSVFLSPFWTAFHAGTMPSWQVFTFLAQLYFRTAGADTHNLAAVERCRDGLIRPHLERHYREELGHATILREGLLACGRGGEEALAAGPQPAMRAFIDSMVVAASEPLRYLGCYGVFHAPWTVRTESDLMAQFEHFTGMYPFAGKAFAAVCSHARLDYALGHEDVVLVRLAREHGALALDAAGVLSALQGARTAAHGLRAVFDGLQGDEHDHGRQRKHTAITATV